ncbi:Otogelin [Lonchura striata]|uniref:Otogelin n=1 Tax=Lonchura striata TaxID=40157 RepID=A0A218UU09_9PASE|nr:Otogelin [Lonchura striata domestica]
MSSEVTYKGFGVKLPYVVGNLHIQKLAGYFLVRHQYAFTLAWDGTSAVYIKMAPEYLGKTQGLCGNNNAILQDDLETSYAITCAEPLTYSECINCCPVSCHQQPQCIGSELHCIDGCYCPDGLIYENELCVKPMDCPCDYHGSFFEMGSVVYEESECSVSGDTHFMTFDGRRYTFQATCQYILAKSRTSGTFTISLQNAPCGQNQDGSCIQSVSLVLKQDPKRQVTLTHSGDVLIYDQYKINLPYADDLFEIRKLSSVFLQVKTQVGLQILYDREGLRLYLQVDERWKDDTVGLCGTFNGNTEDDFLNECPCYFQGIDYPPGENAMTSLGKCHCRNGVMNCDNSITADIAIIGRAFFSICQHGSFQCTFQPCPSMCTAYGDRHYRTFDGLTFDFVGTCKVYLVKGTSSTTLSVIIENIDCFSTGIICRKNVFINVGKSLLVFDDETGNPGELTGLCGNFDLKTVNELRTPDNFELTNSQEFGNSWTAIECVDSSDIRNPCSLNPLREPFAKKECGILLSEAFEACHPVIDVTWFYSNCLTDTCGCNQGGDSYDCEYFNKALGKGPYKLVSYLDGKFVIAAKSVDGIVFPVKEDDVVPGHVVSFMLTSGLYKPKAHDSSLISLETAERPNYFLQMVSNNTLVISKWKKSEDFHNRSTFVIHKNTWLSGYSSFESFAKPGFFIHISASSVELLKYHHSEEFRLSTLFKLVGIEPADDSPPLLLSIQTPSVPHLTLSASLAVISEELTSFPVPEAKDRETTLATKLLLTATTEKLEILATTSNKTLPAITLWPNISSPSTEMISGRSTTAMAGTATSNVSLSASVDISPLFPSAVSSEASTRIQLISSGSTKLLRATEPQTTTATHAVTTRTESERKPVATGTPLILRTTEMPVKTKIMELSEMATRTLPTKEAQVKPEGLTTFTPSSFESITEKTTAYVPQLSTLPLDVPSYIPPVNLTGPSEGTKISVEQSFTTVANVTAKPFSPILTASSLLKPVSSATTEAAAVLTKESVKTTLSPTSTPPTSVRKTTKEPPLGMVQHLTGTPEVLFTTTLGPKMTTLETQETSSETTWSSFTTHKKEIPKITSHVEHTSSSYFPPYLPHASSSTEKSFILSTKRPAVSSPTPASPASGELKKTFRTVSTTGYPLHMVLNTTELLTTLHTKYPVLAETSSVTPFSVKVTSPPEIATKSTLFSGKISTEYKSALVSSTVKTSSPSYSGSVTTPAMKTKETTTAPFVATERESPSSITGSPLALLSGTETTLFTTLPDKSQVESITTISTGKPSALSFSPSGSLISLNISLPSLPSDGKEASLTTLSPMRTSPEITSLYPRTTIQKSMLTTEKTSPVPTLSILSSILEQSSSITTVPDEKSLVNITDATFSLTSEFSSQLITTKKIVTGKEKSSLSPSVSLPLTKPSYTFSTLQYLGDKLVSSPLTQLLPEVTTTPKYSVETKMVSAALKPEVQSITETVKIPAAAAQPSLPPSSAGPFSLQTSPGAKPSVQTTRTTAIPPSSTQKTTGLGRQTSEASLTSQVHQYPAESLTKSPGQPQPVFSITEATVELTSLKTSLPEGTHSSMLPTSVGPTKVILPTQKHLHLTDAVTQPLVSTTSVLQPTVPARETADLIFGTRFPSFSPEVLAASSPSATIKKEPFPSFSTQKTATDLKFTHQASFTKFLDSRQTVEVSPSLDSESTSSRVLLPGATEVPVVLGSTSGESGTEEAVVLPKQVTASATTNSSMVLPRTALSTEAHSSVAASGSPVITSAGQNLSTASAASDKAAAVTEPISSSSSLTSEAKGAVPLDTVKSEESELATGFQSVLTQRATVTSQTFYSPYFTNTASVLSTAHSPAESKMFSSVAPSSVSTAQTSKFEVTSEMQTPSVSSLLMVHDHPNDTASPSLSPFTSSTKPLHGLTTTFSDGLVIAEAMAGTAASPFMLPQETATLQTCTPITESECIKHICLDGQLIQVNKSQHCPYNATQPSCGVLGFATQTNGDKCCPKWECACRCTIFSDLSIVTYDGKHLALFKEASYIVSQTPDETITIHVLDCRMITVNSRSAWPTVRKYGYKVEDSGFKYAVETPTKIRIQWFHNTGVMIIELNSTREPRALGLCGFCDRSLANDLMLPNRTVLSQSSSPSTFIDSWQVPDTLNCKVKVIEEYGLISPEQFCDMWARDTEYIQNPCISLAAYVAMCNKFNICIEWRSSDYCPCTDSSGEPHAVGEIWRTSLSGCCMQKCVDSETIIPVEHNCSESHSLECQRFAEVALLVPDDQTCCPQKICKCACETIPKPQCKLGQKLQIDELFQNSTENVCNCVMYKCVRDKVCLSNERGVLLPGQRIVEHSADGICHISYCTNVVDPSTKYYKINTSSIDCAVKCKANQVYQPPKDLTTCCGSCKNLSCLHTFSNGTVASFKPGAVWISNCIRYECTNTAIGPVLVSSAVGCPPFNETECVKVGGYIVPFLEGCCKTCKEDGKFCKKVTVRMTIRKNDCRSNTPVNIVSCDGKCPSASIYNYNINTYARFCKCCRELGLQRRTVQLYCTSNSTWVSYSIQEPTECSCQWS